MKPINLTKFQNILKKNGLESGFRDPSVWISSGNYAINYITTSHFDRFIPLGKVVMVSGSSGSGKSFLCSGNVIREAQKMGVFVVLLDSEFALDEDWLKALDVDTSPSKLLKVNVSLIDEVSKTIADFMKLYKEDYSELPYEEKPPVLFVIDSLGMLSTPNASENFASGQFKADMGRKSQVLKSMVTETLKLVGQSPVGLLATNHSYQSQNPFDLTDVISGGSGFIYASSIVLGMQKFKSKVNEDGVKGTDILGIRSKLQVVKSRYSKPFEEINVLINWDTGLSPYSGLVDLLEKMGELRKDGNKLSYVDLDGVVHKFFRKDIPNSLLDTIMNEIMKKETGQVPVGVKAPVEEAEEEQ